MNQTVNYGGVCRTAPATPGLLIIGSYHFKPPLTAFKRQPNIRSYLIRAKLPTGPKRYPKRVQKGMKKCNRPDCTACPFINEAKEITINGENWTINKNLNCNSYNIVYAIICKKEGCKEAYLGETKRLLKFRLADHRGYIVNGDTSTATGQHFTSRGHSLADLSIAAIEQAKKNNILNMALFHIKSDVINKM